MDFTAWEQYVISNIVMIATSIVVAGLGFWLARLVRNQLLKTFSKSKKHQTIKLFITKTVYGLVLVVAGIMVLGRLGVPTASLITILGTSSLAIGLALKDFLSNIAAGVILVFQRPFEIGDLVEISGTLGTVQSIDLFHVKVKTPNFETVVIPNGKLIKEKIVNKAHQGIRRLEVKVLISYSANLLLAKRLLRNLCQQDDRVLTDPEPLVAVCDLANSGVELTIRAWVHKDDYNKVKFSLLEQIKLDFDEHQIEIPFPQLDILIKQNPKDDSQQPLAQSTKKALEQSV